MAKQIAYGIFLDGSFCGSKTRGEDENTAAEYRTLRLKYQRKLIDKHEESAESPPIEKLTWRSWNIEVGEKAKSSPFPPFFTQKF